VALLAAALVGCGRGGDAASGHPNVLLVTVDTLRADHLGAYGYSLPTSPSIDALSARGVRFAHATASAPETAPAAASLLTGRLQADSRVRRNGHRLPPEVTTLAEAASKAGWSTAAVVANPLLIGDYGFDQGVTHFTHIRRLDGLSDDRVADAAIEWMRGASAPWFLWVHFMDPHNPPAADPEWSAGFTYPDGAFGDDPPLPRGSPVELRVIPSGQWQDGADRLSQYVRWYDGDVRFTDAQIGRVLDALRAGGQEARTLVVLTADHGESLTEHGELLQHGWFVYEPTLRIPLVVSWPGQLPSGRVVTTRVSGVDVAPTINELAGFGLGPDDLLDGTSLVPCLLGDCARAEPVLALGGRDNHPLALYDGEWKLVQTPGKTPPTPTERTLPIDGFPTAERLELYRLDEDPGELRDVAGAHPDRVAAMRARLMPIRQRLRAFGWGWYPGSSIPLDDGAEAAR